MNGIKFICNIIIYHYNVWNSYIQLLSFGLQDTANIIPISCYCNACLTYQPRTAAC